MIVLLARLALALATLLCVGWVLVLARVWRTINAMRRLPSTGSADGPRPKVTAVVAARNEAHTIETGVCSLLAQDGVEMEVIAVDDNSEDDTHAILERLAAADRRLLVLKAGRVPPGWVAKCYALELGQGRAHGDWLLFTDADVVHGPHAAKNAVAAMERERLDHLAVQPRLEAGGLAEALVLPLFMLLGQLRFLDPAGANPESKVGIGIGAFNLVRADAYRLRGTHARIRGSMLDDRALGRMMREDGGRGSVLRAVAQVRHRPYRSARELYAGVKKSVIGTFGNSAMLTALMGLVLLVAAVAPALLLALGLPLWLADQAPWVVAPAALAVALPMVGLLKARSVVRFEPLAALLFPIGALVIGTCALHAALVFAVRGTVEWRGRFYTRRDLQDHG
ncbi:MAG: glycosyltransferase [Deltaproteobacteria bacterium]|nr:glycosyltransferase [Deltaproteobacteria bacterium]